MSHWLRRAAALAGRRLKDRDGRTLDRAFVFQWRGRTRLLGLSPDSQLRLVGAPQPRLTYWMQSLYWEQAEPPDFDRIRPNSAPFEGPPRVCHVLVTHLDAASNLRMVEEWRRLDPDSLVLLAHGGTREDFAALPPGVEAVYVDDPALRTREHAREKQEYLGVIRSAAAFLKSHPDITHVHLVEYDLVPVVEGLGRRLVEALRAEDADLCGSGLYDLTGTIHPHLLNMEDDRGTRAYVRSLSLREDKSRVLTMLGCTGIWTAPCFQSIAALEPPGRIYLEIASATLAHHLGWRVRPLPASQRKSVTFRGDLGSRAEEFISVGAWMIHPWKSRWKGPGSTPSGSGSGSGYKPRLLLCGHTYAVKVNRAKAAALSQWFDVLVCAPDFEGVLVFGRDGSLQDSDEPDPAYTYRRLPRWPRKTGFVRSFLSGLSGEIRRWKPDYILCEAEPWAFPRWQARWLAWRSGKRPVFVEFTWENIPRHGLKGLILRAVYRLAAGTTDGVVVGNLGAERLFLEAGLPPKRILRTGQLGVDASEHPVADPETKAAWRRRHGFSPDALVIGFCGRLIEQKGVFDLQDAVSRLRVTNPSLELALLGSGVLEPELRRRIGAETWCRILPPVFHGEVPGEIGCFDLMVLPSKPQLDPARGDIWEEQFGHVLLEAMLCGVPVLGSSCGAIPEVLEDPEVIFPAGDVDALTALMDRWLSDRSGLAALAETQRLRTAEKWSHAALAERYARFMLSLNSRARRPPETVS